MTSESTSHENNHGDAVAIDETGYAFDYPVEGSLKRLTYEEIHTLNVLLTNTIHFTEKAKQMSPEIQELVKYIEQYRNEGRVIYHLISGHLPGIGNEHNVINRVSDLIHREMIFSKDSLDYIREVKLGLSIVLQYDFCHVAIHPKTMF
ncbi:MAG: hypothetical protein ACXAE3_01675 [Candidatus Kariarchaeaceae archaeon]|jgi:hypothetical protein